MPDPYQQVSAGDPFTGIPATVWNDLLVMLADWKKKRDSRTGGFSNTPPNPGMVLVYNNGNADVDQYGVLSLPSTDNFVIDPGDFEDAFLDAMILSGGVPSTSYGLNFVVALEPIPQGTIGRAQAFGPAEVQIQVTSTTNGLLAADMLSGDVTQLALTPGGFRVIQIDDYDTDAGGTQTLWGIVNLGLPEGIITVRQDASQDGTHPLGTTRIYDLISSPYVNTTPYVTAPVLNQIKSVASATNKTGYVVGQNGQYVLLGINPCSD